MKDRNIGMGLFETLTQAFDQIYILTLSNRKDRRALIERQLLEMGFPQPDCDARIRYWYATPFPFNGLIANAFNKSGCGKFTKANEYDCARNHYSIIKTAYDIGLEHVLVLEDDILFLKDTELFSDFIKTMPDDYDICQMGGFTANPGILKYILNDKRWFKHKDVGLWNSSAYALSRRGMEFYLTYMDKIKFWVADGPFYKAPLSEHIINTYASNVPLVIQADKNKVASDIRDESNDNIDYNNENMYEKYVRLEDYFPID